MFAAKLLNFADDSSWFNLSLMKPVTVFAAPWATSCCWLVTAACWAWKLKYTCRALTARIMMRLKSKNDSVRVVERLLKRGVFWAVGAVSWVLV